MGKGMGLLVPVLEKVLVPEDGDALCGLLVGATLEEAAFGVAFHESDTSWSEGNEPVSSNTVRDRWNS